MSLPATAEALGAPVVFGHYLIDRVLGTGGMGTVYAATHLELKKRVALKTLLPAYAGSPEARARFLREGELAARLHHPHVVDVTDLGLHEGVPFLVMEFLEGEDLAAALEREVQIFPDVLADLLVPVVAALACAHDQGIVHRDLKPQNIFLVPTRAGPPLAKVLDFGISKLLDPAEAHLTGSLSVLGTPSYMSPEQVRSGKGVDARSDQYSLGVILYQCATGRLPFAGDTVFELMTAVANGVYPRPRDVCTGLPEGFEALILKAMSLAPDQRFPTTRGLGAALLRFATERVRLNWADEFAGRADSVPVARLRALSLSQLRPGPNLRVAALSDTQVSGSGPVAPVALPIALVPKPATLPSPIAVVERRGARRWVLPLLSGALLLGGGTSAIWWARSPPLEAPWPPVVAVMPPVIAPPPAPVIELRPPSPALVAVVAVAPGPASEPVASPARHRRGSRGTGTLAIVGLLHGEPAWANATIDGVPAARQTPLTAALGAGRHRVELSRPGLRPVHANVQIARGESAKLRLELAP